MGYWISGTVCAVFIYATQLFLFGSGAKRRSTANLTSFFPPSEYMKNDQRAFITCITPFPLTIAFIGILSLDKSFSTLYTKYLSTHCDLGPLLSSALSTAASVKIESLPPAYFPILTVVMIIAFFGWHLKAIFRRVEATVLSVSGIETRIHEQVSSFASKVLEFNNNNYVEVIKTITAHKKIDCVPLADELERSPADQKLAYQLMHLTRKDVGKLGIYCSLLEFTNEIFGLEKNDVADLTEGSRRWIFELISACVIYIVVATLYGLLAHKGSGYFSELGFPWPREDEIEVHMRDVFFFSASVVLPAILGIAYFSNQRYSDDYQERKALCMLFAVVLVVSFFLLVLYQLIFSLEILADQVKEDSGPVGMEGTNGDKEREVFGFCEFFYSLLYALVPSLVVLTTVMIGPRGKRTGEKVVAGTLVFGLGLFIAQYVYESLCAEGMKFWLHQCVMGALLGCTSLSLKAVFFPR
ncbi:MAG: hypothetical protein OXC01_14400 [Immundisolibacterales bacterium]|nr:hypothetical protein [Immundisolibacterales bacterium]